MMCHVYAWYAGKRVCGYCMEWVYAVELRRSKMSMASICPRCYEEEKEIKEKDLKEDPPILYHS